MPISEMSHELPSAAGFNVGRMAIGCAKSLEAEMRRPEFIAGLIQRFLSLAMLAAFFFSVAGTAFAQLLFTKQFGASTISVQGSTSRSRQRTDELDGSVDECRLTQADIPAIGDRFGSSPRRLRRQDSRPPP